MANPNFHCPTCRSVYASMDNLNVHLKNAKAHRILCAHPEHEHNSAQGIFESLEQALDWVRTRELDQMFVVTTTSRNRRYILYRCRHFVAKKNQKQAASLDQPFKPRLRQRRSLPYYPCTARFIINQVDLCQCPPTAMAQPICRQKGLGVRVYGCLTHCHELKGVNHRISQVTKDYIIGLLRSGVPKPMIMQRFAREKVTEYPEYQLITMQHLRSWEKNYVKDLGYQVPPVPPEYLNQHSVNAAQTRRKKALDLVSEWQARLASDESNEGVDSIIQHVEAFNRPPLNVTITPLPADMEKTSPTAPVLKRPKSKRAKIGTQRKVKERAQTENEDSDCS